MHRREPVVIRNGRLCAGAYQQVRDGEIVDVRGPMKSGRPVALGRVDVDALLDERANGRRVLAAHSLDEARVGTRGAERDAAREHEATIHAPGLFVDLVITATRSSRLRGRCCRRTCP